MATNDISVLDRSNSIKRGEAIAPGSKERFGVSKYIGAVADKLSEHQIISVSQEIKLKKGNAASVNTDTHIIATAK